MDENMALEELQFIKKVIEDSKRSIIYNGIHYIVWGILVILGMCATYAVVVNRMNFNYIWIWIVVAAVGWIFSFYLGLKSKHEQPHTFSNKIIGVVWLAAGIGMMILGFIGPASGSLHPVYISPVLSVVLGMGYLITGQIVESKWLSYLSLGWWSGAVYMFFFPGDHTLIVMAIMMLFFQTIPGIIMYRKYKQEMAA